MSRSPRKTFSPDEKHLIINFVRNNKDTIENKNNDMKLVKEKKQKWEELSQIFAVKGYDRDPQRLREYYHRMKCNAKSIIRAYHKHIKYNETIPAQAPSEFDWSLFEIVREDIMEDGEEDIKPDETSEGNSEDVRYEYEVETNHKRGSVQTNSSNKRIKKDLSEENELELLKYKKQLELQLHEEQLKLVKEKHRAEMESVILLQKKLKMELDAATITKIKMEKEAEKIEKEMILIQRQIENENNDRIV